MSGNTSTIAEGANVNAVVWEGHESHTDMYQNKCPKGQNNRAPRPGAIAIFSILTPPVREVKTRTKRARVGLIPFSYIIRIDVQNIKTSTHL